MITHLLLIAVATAASPYRPLPAEKPAATATACPKGKHVMGSKAAGPASPGGVANLPFARGRTFEKLDEYLAYLECHAAPIDQPWWREIRPGVYEHVKTATNAKREIATRAELMQRFGFSK